MVFDRCGSSRAGRPLWMENILPKGAHGASYGGGGYSEPPVPYLPPGHTSVVALRSLPPYHAPPMPPPSRYHYPTYTSPWLVRVSLVLLVSNSRTHCSVVKRWKVAEVGRLWRQEVLSGGHQGCLLGEEDHWYKHSWHLQLIYPARRLKSMSTWLLVAFPAA